MSKHADVHVVHSQIYMSLLSFLVLRIHGETYYCSRPGVTTITGTHNGTIKTVYEGQSTYDKDVVCEWVIDAGEDSFVALDIIESHLTWAPAGAICSGYDYMEVRNGYDDNADVIVSWCGERNPYNIHSSGRFIYLAFRSTSRPPQNFRGVTVSFSVFSTSMSLGSCPPGWSDDPALPDGGGACFWLSPHKQSWILSQRYCSYQQANLADLDSPEQADFVTDLISSHPDVGAYDDVWIGLNDIANENVYAWINISVNTDLFRWREVPHKSDDFLNCVCMQSYDGKWKEDFCNENSIQTTVKYNFLCKINKVGLRKIYTIPDDRIDKGGKEGVDAPVRLIVICIAVGVIVIAMIVVGVFVYKKKSRYRPRNNSSPGSSVEMAPANQHPPEAPPTYNEAVGNGRNAPVKTYAL